MRARSSWPSSRCMDCGWSARRPPPRLLPPGGRSRRSIFLLSDLNLPDGSGGEVAAALQQIHPAMRSLFMSGASRPPPLGAGQAFLQKPVRIAAVLREIDDLLRS